MMLNIGEETMRLPPISLPGWKIQNVYGIDMLGKMFGPVMALLTWDTHLDNAESSSMGGAGTYRHISLSCGNRYPTWDEMKEIVYNSGVFDKRFDVLMILPRQDRPEDYVNIHQNTFHWVQKVGGWE